jgi:DNA-directed RNA polymerase specialized sigma24 family protein
MARRAARAKEGEPTVVDLDAEIVELRVSGMSEAEICLKLGCALGRVRAALDESRRQ